MQRKAFLLVSSQLEPHTWRSRDLWLAVCSSNHQHSNTPLFTLKVTLQNQDGRVIDYTRDQRTRQRTDLSSLSASQYRRGKTGILHIAELRAAEKLNYRQIFPHLSTRNLISNAHKWWRTAKESCGLGSNEYRHTSAKRE